MAGIIKPVNFGKQDRDVLEYSQRIGNFSAWAKSKLREEMQGGTLRAMVEQIINERLGAVKQSENQDVSGYF